jgi:hypothetical protein
MLERKEHTLDKLVTNNIDKTRRTPAFSIDSERGVISIEGRSMPANANDFYLPVIKKLGEYIKDPAEETICNFKLEYIDSSSSQLILLFIKKLKYIEELGYPLTVRWYYMEDDYDIYETGKTFAYLSDVEFDFISYF